MAPHNTRYFLADLAFAVALCGLMLALGRGLWRADVLDEKFDPITYFFLVALVMMLLLSWGLFDARRKAPECVECGRRFLPPRKSTGQAICPRSRRRTLGPEEMRKERANGLWTILILLAILAFFMGFGLSDLAKARFGRFSGLALPLLAVGATLGLSAAPLIAYVLFALIRDRMMLGEKYALAHARKVAGEEGEESSLGPVKLWYSGAIDPAPMLLEQMETVRGRFAAMVGEAVEVRGPLRIFCFAGREALVAFHRQTATDLWNHDGIYSPARTLTLATEVVRHRTCATEATARSLFALALLEQYKGFLPAPWLQAGINHALTAGEDGPDRLNRKMFVSIDKDSAFGEELFRFRPKEFFKLLRNWPVHEDHARLTRFIAQSWSLIDYLCGEDAPEDRRGRFRAYLTAIGRGETDEAVFLSHFGHGYDRLLEGWRGWVTERGVGTHGPPSPRIRATLTGRLIPTALDRRARIMDRILAIRALGWEGHVLGADALIDLLREGGEIPKEEVIWSLEMISGMAWGDDLDRWASWWDDLPEDVREGRGRQGDHAGKLPIPDET